MGTIMIRKFIVYISRHNHVDVIVLDPDITNIRAIRCYEKCGFIKVKKINKGVSRLMEYRKRHR
ncbi:GNAT family N-acetyltransferase [Paenibacillus chitinolyticus]|uniref:GNAT family N-acetyltransferase n=1 Tax=Paenibacillus chitinolyticus TaxID=79263 RepID=UPI003863DAD4